MLASALMKSAVRALLRGAIAWIGIWAVVSASALAADPAELPSPAVLAAISDDEAPPLPNDFGPGERDRLPILLPDFPLVPPAGAVHTPPEYARNRGLLLRWGVFNAVLTAMTVAITTADPAAVVTIVVASAGQQASASSTLSGAGADLSQVGFLVAPSDSVWIRDYGPRFILEDNALAIVDHEYNRPRDLDDVIPGQFGAAWSLPVYDIPLVHGGGNFHLFADGDAFMTDLILDENSGLSATDVQVYFADYENLDLTIWPGFPTSYDSTQHIDMWFLPVRDKVAIVGEYPVSATLPRQITEDAVDELESRGYTVYRTPGWRTSGTHYTYANAVVFNELVLVPTYSSYPAQNSQALAVFTQAFPGKQIVGIDADDVVSSAGVLHCIVMHVPDPDWLFEDGFETADTSVWSGVFP